MKIKKSSSIYILFFLTMIFAGACKKDMLNQNPLNRISDATFWTNSNDLKLYCNNFYQLLPTNPSSNANYYIDNNSDNLCPTTRNTRLNGENVVPATGGGWAYSDWQQIRNVNYFFSNYQKVNAAPSEIATYIGEAYFFRAWFYFDKLRNFGALPWINTLLDPADKEGLLAGRLPRNVIADSIVADLDRAIGLLKPKASAAAMRINKEIAQAFKTRVCLYEGTWEKYHNGTTFGVEGRDGSTFLQKAAEEAEALMQSSSVGLDNIGVDNGYAELFNQVDYATSKEVLFWRKYQVGVLTTPWNRYSNTGGGTGISKDMVESFLCTDGKPISVSLLYEGDATLADVVKNRDPRLKQILYTPGDLVTTNTADRIDVLFSKPGFTLAHDQRNTTGYQLKKGNNTDAAQIDYTTRGLIYIRFGEVLLNFAEAKAELGTLTQDDADKSINLLRERVGMPSLVVDAITPDPEWAFTDLPPVINEVRRERRVELSCEGFRFDDIMRWAAAGELIKGYKYKGAKWAQWDGEFPTLVPGVNIFLDAQGYIDPFQQDQLLANGFQFNVNRDYLLPLPVDQLTLNPALGQNPGW
jgi:hypothetical protein